MAKDPERSSRGEIAPRYSDPFGALRSEMDRLFDSFTGGLPTFPGMFGPSGARGFALMPSMDVKETDKEITIEAELPGLDEKDVSLTVQNGVLTIEGEKKLEHEEEKENYHVMERRYGTFPTLPSHSGYGQRRQDRSSLREGRAKNSASQTA
jgi:HSP20 family protein